MSPYRLKWQVTESGTKMCHFPAAPLIILFSSRPEKQTNLTTSLLATLCCQNYQAVSEILKQCGFLVYFS